LIGCLATLVCGNASRMVRERLGAQP